MSVGKPRLSKTISILVAVVITVLSILGLYIQTGYVRYTDAGWGPATTLYSASIQLQNTSIVAQLQTDQQTRALAYDPSNDMIYVATTEGSEGAIDVISNSNHSIAAAINFPEGIPSVLVFDDAYNNLYAYDSTHGDNIYVINTSTNKITGNVSTGINGTIGGAVYDPINRDLYVAGGTANSLIVVSTITNRVFQSINVGGNPIFVVYDQTNGYIYVQSGATGESVRSSTITIVSPLALIPAISNAIISTLNFSAEGNGICYDQDTGDIYAIMNYPAAISEISSQTNKVMSTIFLPFGFGLNDASRILYDGPRQLLLVRGNNSLLEFNSSSVSFLKGFELTGLNVVSVNTANGYVYASLISANEVLELAP